MANRQWLARVDFGMSIVRSHGLSVFVPRRRPTALQHGETLYFAEIPDGSGHTRMRACLENPSTGERWLALPENVDEHGNIDSPTWHVNADFGSVGFPGLVFLKNGLGLRMTAIPDRLHQLMCCWSGGVADANLMLKRLEFKPLCDLRFGPFGRQGHHSTLTECAKEFFAAQTYKSPLFQLFYDNIVEDLGDDDPSLGSEAHQRGVFERVKAELVGARQGARVREGRWWNLEARGMAVLENKSALLMLLVYLGFQRRWWTSFSESPLQNLELFQGKLEADDVWVCLGVTPTTRTRARLLPTTILRRLSKLMRPRILREAQVGVVLAYQLPKLGQPFGN